MEIFKKNVKPVYQSKYVEILLDEEDSIIIDRFLPNTREMQENDFKTEMIIFAEMCQKYKPQFELVHLLDMQFTIAPEIQEWMNEVIFPKYANIIKKMAFLLPKDVFAMVSVEQTMNEEQGKKFMQACFDCEHQAFAWLTASA